MAQDQVPQLPTPEELRRKRAEERARYTVGIVSPNGEVDIHVVRPGQDLHGDEVVGFIKETGEAAILKRAKARGYRLLADFCKEDGVPELYGQWLEAARARQRGITVKGDPTALYPPSVLRLRAAVQAGGVDGKVFVIGEGLVEASPAEKVAAKLESLGIQVPKAEPEKAPSKSAK